MARKRTGLNACGGYKYNGNTYTAQELFDMLKDGELENLVKEGKITLNPEDMPLLSKKFQSVEANSTKQPVQPIANTEFKQGDTVHFRFRGKTQTVQSKAKIEQIIEKDGVPAFVKLEGISKQIPITDISAKPFGGVEEAKKAAEAKAEKTPMSKFEKAKQKGFALVEAINKTKAKVYSFVDEKVLERSGWTKQSVVDFQKAFNAAFNSASLGKKKLGKDVQIILMNNSQMLDWTAANQPEAYKSAVAGKMDVKGVLVSADGSVVIINVDKASNTTPLHEIAGHIWESWAKKNAPTLYNAMIKKVDQTKYFAMLSKVQDMMAEGKSIAQVMQSLKNTKEFKGVFADKKATEGFLDLLQYINHGVNNNLSRETIDGILRSEIFAKVIETNAEILGSHEDKSVIQSFKDFIVELFNKLKEISGFKGLNVKALGEMDINQFAQAVLSELSAGELSTDVARKIKVAEAGMAEESTESQIIPEAKKSKQNVTEEEEFEVNEDTAEEENKGIDESEQEEVKEVTIEDVMNEIADSDEPNIYESMDVAEAAKQAIGNIPYLKTIMQYANNTLLKSKDEAKRAEAAELMDNPKVFLNSRLEDLKAAEQTEETVKEIAEIEAAIAEIDRINELVEGSNKVLTTFGADGDVVSDVSAFSFIRSTPESILKPLLELITKTKFFQDAKEADASTNPADILEGILTQRYALSKEDRATMGSIVEGPLKKFWDYHTAKLKSEDEFMTSAKLQDLFKKEYNKSVNTAPVKEAKRKIKSAKIKINKEAKNIFAKVKALEVQLGKMTDPEAKARVRAEINTMLKAVTKFSVAAKELDKLAYDSFFYEDMNNVFGLEEFGEEGFYRLLGAMPYVRGKYIDTVGVATSYKETSKSGDIVGDNEVITSHVLKSENGNILASFEITKNYDTNQGHVSFLESDKMFGDPQATKEAFIAATRMLQMEGLTPVIDQYMSGQVYDTMKEYAAEGLLIENKLAPKENVFGPQDEVMFYGVPPFQYNFDGVFSIEPKSANSRQLTLFSLSTTNLEDNFYYPLEKRLTEMKDEVKTAKQWNDILKGGDEYNFSNLKDYLESFKPEEKIKKQDIINYFNDNKPKFEVVSYTNDDIKLSKSEITNLEKEVNKEIVDLYEEWLMSPDYETWEEENPGANNEDAYNHLKPFIDDILKKYALEKDFPYEYAIVQKAISKSEDLLGIPIPPKIKVSTEYVPENQLIGVGRHVQNYEKYIQKGNYENYNLTTVNLVDPKIKFTSSHFIVGNNILHVRTTIRKDINGNKILFVEEIQSDWGQQGRTGVFKSEKNLKEYEKKLKVVEENKIKAKKAIKDVININANFTKQAIDIVENLFKSLKNEGVDDIFYNLDSDITENPKYIKANKIYKKLFDENVNKLSEVYPQFDEEEKFHPHLWSTPYFYHKKEQNLYNFIQILVDGNIEDLESLLEYKDAKPVEQAMISGFLGEYTDDLTGDSSIDNFSPEVDFYEDAPFVKETSAWAKLGVKIAIQQAVKNGCNKISWTTGEQQDKVNGKSKPTYHNFYGSPTRNELGSIGNIFKKVLGQEKEVSITKISFSKNAKIEGAPLLNKLLSGNADVFTIDVDNETIEKTYAGMPMFSLGAPQTNAAIAPTSQTNGVNNTLAQTGVTPNAGQQAPLNAQQQGHINNIANSYRNLNPYTQIQFQQFQPENKSILAQANRALTRQTVASLGLGTEYILAKESMVGYEANQKSELQKESQAALKLLTSEKYQNDPSLKGTTIEAKMNLIQLALSGDPIAFNVLPVDFQPTITAMRNRIDSLSEAMIRSGWLKLGTAEAFANGMGNYLRRQYKKFTLKEKAWEKYANNLDPQVRDKAIEGFYTWVSEGFYTEPQTMANQPGFVPLYQRWRTYNQESKKATKLETRLNALESRLNLKQQQLPQRQNQQTAQNTIAKLQKDIADVKAELNPLQVKLAADFPVLDADTYDLAEKGLQDLLDAPETSSSLNPYTGSQIQMATLKKRLGEQELPGWMRDVMGEIKDPVMNYQMTVSNLVNMTSRLKFLNDVYTLAKRDGFIYNDIQLSAKEREQLKKDGWINVDGTNEGTPQTRFGPFIGTWIKPELYDFAFGTDAEISAIYSIRGWVLIGKTAGNVLFGPIRNFFGNGSFLLVNGSATKFFANLKNGVSKSDYDYMKSLPGKNLGSKFYKFWDSAIDDAEKLGLFQTVNTEWAKETFGKISKDTVLMKAFERSEAEGWAYFYKNYVVNLAKWVKDGAVQSYIWADILPKLTSFTTTRNNLANKFAVAAGLPSGLSYNTLANPSQSHPLYNEIKAAIKPEQLEVINQMAGHQTNLSMVTSDRVAPIVANMPKKTKYKGKSAAGIGAAATKDALTLVFGGDFPRFVAESMRIFLQQLANVATINKTYEQNVFKVFDDKKANDEFLTSLNREQRAHTLAGLISWSGVMSQIVPYFGSLGSALLAMAGLGGGDDDDDQPEVDNNKSAQVSTKPGFTTEGFMNKNRNLGAEMYRLYQSKINGGMSIDEALREVSREFEQNHQLDFKLLGEGKFMRQDVSSIDPFTVFTAIPRSILYRPERGFYNKLTGNVSSLYEEYLGVEMGVSTAMDLIKNENPYTGLPIYNEQADFIGKKGAAMLYHSVQTLAPTFITKALKMYDKSKDKVNERTGEVTEGKPLDKQMLIELQSAAYGRTYYEENPRKLLYNLIKPLYAGKAGAVRQKTYFKDLNILKDVCYRMNRKVQAMRTLGMKEDEIADVVGDIIREDSIWEAVYYGGSYIDNLQLEEDDTWEKIN